MDRLEKAKARMAAAKVELKAAYDELHEATIAASPFKVGQIYTRQDKRGYGSKAKTITLRGQVTGFAREYGKTLPVLTMFKADGSLGVLKRSIRWQEDWKLESDRA